MSKPKIRFKGFDNEWAPAKLSSMAVEIKRKAPADSDAPVMMISASNGFIKQSERYSNDNAGHSLANYTLLKEGELAYNHGFSSLRKYGSCFDLKVPEARVPFVYHSFYITDGLPSFFAHYLNCGIFDSQLRKMVCSTARMDGLLNISFDTYSTLEISKPESDEQQSISDFFDCFNSLISTSQDKINRLKSLKICYLSQLFPIGGGTEPPIRIAGFSGEWDNIRLGDIATKIRDKNTNSSIKEVFTNSAAHGIISQRDFFDHDIAKQDNISNYIIVSPDDFVYNPRISVTSPVGPINRNKTRRTGVVSPLYTVFRVNDINVEYLEYYFKSSMWHQYMRYNGNTGARHDRFAITDEDFFNMPIPVPRNSDEQLLIADYFKHIDSFITLHSEELERLKSLKQSCLDSMFVKP